MWILFRAICLWLDWEIPELLIFECPADGKYQ